MLLLEDLREPWWKAFRRFYDQKIDTDDKHPFVKNVSYLRRMTVFALLAFWLMATQHCGLEAAGLLDNHPESASPVCCNGQGHCTHDGCDLVERGSITSSNGSIKVPMPSMHECVCLLCLQVVALSFVEPAKESVQGIDKPLGWVPTWHFERRAAPSPRAPALNLA